VSITTRTDPLLRPESYVHDSQGNLVLVTDRKGQATQTTVDALDRPTQVLYQDGSTTSYTWDTGNRLTQVVDSLSGTLTRVYDGLDRLVQETTPQGTVSYGYDAAGRRTSMTASGQAAVSYTYDAADRLTQITQGSATVTFSYDDANRRTSLTLPNGLVTEYSYDAASRLTGLTYKNGSTVLGTLTYSYDAAGDRSVMGGTWAATGLPQPVASATYDAANQQLTFGTQALTYDANGSLIGDGVNTYTWDARNRLVAINGTSITASFGYDALGRRWNKAINGTSTQFLYDGLNPVQEQGAGTTANLLTGLAIDEYLTRTDDAGTRTFLTDALGSTLALADDTGAVHTRYTYEPFGAATLTGTADANPFQYTGRENDGTALYYYRARYYHPQLQRFMSEDPLDLLGHATNPYVYGENDPLSLVDRLGLRVELGNYVLSNSFVIANLYRLNQAIVDRGAPDTSFVLRVTGGDRYLGCAGEIRSATDDRIIRNTDSTTPHLWDNGARAVDLAVTGVSNAVFDAGLVDTDFSPAYTDRRYSDRHTHISLPPGRKFRVAPDSLPPLGGRYGLSSCGPLF
jgi:RHS repeat-associated protein